MPARTLGSKRGGFVGGPTSLEKEKSASEDTQPQIVDCEIPHWFERGSPKGKVERRQYLLVVGVGRYMTQVSNKRFTLF